MSHLLCLVSCRAGANARIASGSCESAVARPSCEIQEISLRESRVASGGTLRREKGKKPAGKAPQSFRLNQTKAWTWEDRDLDGTSHSHGQSAPKGPLIPSLCCKIGAFINRIAQQMNFSLAAGFDLLKIKMKSNKF